MTTYEQSLKTTFKVQLSEKYGNDPVERAFAIIDGLKDAGKDTGTYEDLMTYVATQDVDGELIQEIVYQISEGAGILYTVERTVDKKPEGLMEMISSIFSPQKVPVLYGLVGLRNGERDGKDILEVQYGGGQTDCVLDEEGNVKEILEFNPEVTAAREAFEELKFQVLPEKFELSKAIYSVNTNSGLPCWVYLIHLTREEEQELRDNFIASVPTAWDAWNAVKDQDDEDGREPTKEEYKLMPEMLDVVIFPLDRFRETVPAFFDWKKEEKERKKEAEKKFPEDKDAQKRAAKLTEDEEVEKIRDLMLVERNGDPVVLRGFQNFFADIVLKKIMN